MQALVALVAIPLALLNLLAGIAGCIWLAFEGEWGLIGIGLLYAFTGTFIVSLALLPTFLLIAPISAAAERGNTALAFFLGLPSMAWTYIVLFGSCFLFMSYAAALGRTPLVPYLLWAYATALGPWSYMARKEAQSGNEASLYTVSGAQLATMLMGIALLIDPTDHSLDRLIFWMIPGVCLAALLQGLNIYTETRRYGY